MINERLDIFLSQRNNAGLLRDIACASSPCLNFASHDYLGLSHHPVVIDGARDALLKYGMGAGASRLVAGNQSIHKDLEDEISQDRNRCCLIFNSGYQANISILAALLSARMLGAEPLVFSDRLNHASMHAGCELAHVRQYRYQHLDMTHLEDLLRKYEADSRPKFILTESVFSMDGDCIDIAALVDLKHRYGAFLYIDEAHAVGMRGEKGYGVTEGFEVDVDCIMGTFSKALGGFGAFVLTSQLLKTYLMNACQGFIYSTALPPVVIGGVRAAWKFLPLLDSERQHVQALATVFDGSSHIIPYVVGDAAETTRIASVLRALGIQVGAMRPPSVPLSQLRIALSASHTFADVKRLKQVLESKL